MAENAERVVVETETVTEAENNKNRMKDRKLTWAKLRRVDSLNLEAGRLSFSHSKSTTSKVLYFIRSLLLLDYYYGLILTKRD